MVVEVWIVSMMGLLLMTKPSCSWPGPEVMGHLEMHLIAALASPLVPLIFLLHPAILNCLARPRHQHSSVLPNGYAKNSMDDVDTKCRVNEISYMNRYIHVVQESKLAFASKS